MPELYSILQIVAAGFLIPPLVWGARSDIRTRRFPASYWYPWIYIAGFFTALSYILMIVQGEYIAVSQYLVISVIAGCACFAMGIQFGSGGDWRAFMFIALATPFYFLQTFGLSLIAGAVQGVVELLRARSNGKHVFEVTIPWAVGICVAFCLAVLVAIGMAI